MQAQTRPKTPQPCFWDMILQLYLCHNEESIHLGTGELHSAVAWVHAILRIQNSHLLLHPVQ